MNIFFLDYNHKQNAEHHCDRHVIKLILESAQMACTAHHLLPGPSQFTGKFYRATHKNHPMTKWVAESVGNYFFCTKYGLALCEEYTYRYSKRHATQNLLEWLRRNPPNIDKLILTEPPLCMPDEYKIKGNITGSYKKYYKYKYTQIDMKWTKREAPEWLNLK